MKTPISFTSAGDRVSGQFFLASGEPPSPTVLLLPGFPGNNDDVLGLGARMSRSGINAFMFNYRGTHQSEGTYSLSATLQDIEAAHAYLGREEEVRRFQVDRDRMVLGGYSYGGGMVDAMFQELESPAGPVRFAEAPMAALLRNPAPYDLRLSAAALADRDILLVGGWDDAQVTFEHHILPFYRALAAANAQRVRIMAFQDDHAFENSREELATAVIHWVRSSERQNSWAGLACSAAARRFKAY